MNVTNALARLPPRSQHHYSQLPLFGRIMDAFAGWSLNRGFSIKTARFHIASLHRLVPWFQRRGKRSVEDLSADDITKVRRYYRLRNPHWAAGAQKAR